MGKQIYIFQHFAGSIIHQLGGYIYTEQSLVSGLSIQSGPGPQSLGAQSQMSERLKNIDQIILIEVCEDTLSILSSDGMSNLLQ